MTPASQPPHSPTPTNRTHTDALLWAFTAPILLILTALRSLENLNAITNQTDDTTIQDQGFWMIAGVCVSMLAETTYLTPLIWQAFMERRQTQQFRSWLKTQLCSTQRSSAAEDSASQPADPETGTLTTGYGTLASATPSPLSSTTAPRWATPRTLLRCTSAICLSTIVIGLSAWWVISKTANLTTALAKPGQLPITATIPIFGAYLLLNLYELSIEKGLIPSLLLAGTAIRWWQECKTAQKKCQLILGLTAALTYSAVMSTCYSAAHISAGRTLTGDKLWLNLGPIIIGAGLDLPKYAYGIMLASTSQATDSTCFNRALMVGQATYLVLSWHAAALIWALQTNIGLGLAATFIASAAHLAAGWSRLKPHRCIQASTSENAVTSLANLAHFFGKRCRLPIRSHKAKQWAILRQIQKPKLPLKTGKSSNNLLILALTLPLKPIYALISASYSPNHASYCK